jgi:syntaxin 1B/2/3
MLSKISSIQDELQRFDANVSRIGDLHSRLLNNTDEALSQQNADALDGLVEETRALSNQIKNQIQDLEKESVPQGQDPRIRRNQASVSLRHVYAFTQIFDYRPPSSVQNSSKLYRTISK